jgi:hypothetical protein
MDRGASPVTSITATILATVTKGRCPSAESSPSIISTRTKLGMGEATSLLMPATTRTRSTAPDILRDDPAANTVKEWFNEVNEEPHFVERERGGRRVLPSSASIQILTLTYSLQGDE